MTKLRKEFVNKITKVEQLIEYEKFPEERREYLGASIIGKKCPRELWYIFRWYKKPGTFTARQHRLFQRGHREEQIVLEDLKRIGVKVESTQKGATTAEGHISAHNDGILSNVPDAPKTKHIFEGKTTASKYYSVYKREKNLKRANYEYYAQTQIYMHLFKIKRCLFVVVNKDNDDRYYERIRYNKKEALELLQKAVDIINATVPPPALIGNDYYCNYFCKQSGVCKAGEKPDINCRTCRSSEPTEKGKWLCRKRKEKRNVKKQIKACKKHKPIKF